MMARGWMLVGLLLVGCQSNSDLTIEGEGEPSLAADDMGAQDGQNNATPAMDSGQPASQAAPSGMADPPTPTADSTPPAIVSVSPSTLSAVAAGDTIEIVFSEAISPGSLPSSWFVSGLAAHAEFDTARNALRITLDETPLFGVHALSVGALTDLAGNTATFGVIGVYTAPSPSSAVVIDNPGASAVDAVAVAVVDGPDATHDRTLVAYRHARSGSAATLVVRGRVEGQPWLDEQVIETGPIGRPQLVAGKSRALLVYTRESTTVARVIDFSAAPVVGAPEVVFNFANSNPCSTGSAGDAFAVAERTGNIPRVAIYDAAGWHHDLALFDTGFTAFANIQSDVRIAGSASKLAFAWTQKSSSSPTAPINVYWAVYDTITQALSPSQADALDDLSTTTNRAARDVTLTGIPGATAGFVWAWLQQEQVTQADRLLRMRYEDATFVESAPAALAASAATGPKFSSLVAAASSAELRFAYHSTDTAPSLETLGCVMLGGGGCGSAVTLTSDVAQLPSVGAQLALAVARDDTGYRSLVAWAAPNGEAYAAYTSDTQPGSGFDPVEGLGVFSAGINQPPSLYRPVLAHNQPPAIVAVRGDAMAVRAWGRPLSMWLQTLDTSTSAPSDASVVAIHGNDTLLAYSDATGHARTRLLSDIDTSETVDVATFTTEARYLRTVSGEHGALVWSKPSAAREQVWAARLNPFIGFLPAERVDAIGPGEQLSFMDVASFDRGLVVAYIARDAGGAKRLYARSFVDGAWGSQLLLRSSSDVCPDAGRTIVSQDVRIIGGATAVWLVPSGSETNPCAEAFRVDGGMVQRVALPQSAANANQFAAAAAGSTLSYAWIDNATEEASVAVVTPQGVATTLISAAADGIALALDGAKVVVVTREDFGSKLIAHTGDTTNGFTASTLSSGDSVSALSLRKRSGGWRLYAQLSALGIVEYAYRSGEGFTPARPLGCTDPLDTMAEEGRPFGNAFFCANHGGVPLPSGITNAARPLADVEGVPLTFDTTDLEIDQSVATTQHAATTLFWSRVTGGDPKQIVVRRTADGLTTPPVVVDLQNPLRWLSAVSTQGSDAFVYVESAPPYRLKWLPY